MKTPSALNRFGWLTLVALLAALPLRAGQYFQDFTGQAIGATTNFGFGSALFSTHLGSVAGVVDSNFKELRLTADTTSGTRSAFLLPDLDPGTPVYAFSAKWNATVSGNFPNAADGFSFNFGQLQPLNLISGSYAQESGYPTGMTFSVQTFSGNNPGFYLRINGNTVAPLPYTPATQWGVNNPHRHFFEVDWHYTNGITVRVDGQTVFANVATPGFIVQSNNVFAFAARTGGLAEEVRVDNILVMTGGNLKQVPATTPYYFSAGSLEPQQAFDGNLTGDNNFWADYSPPSGEIGATLSSSRVIKAYALTSGGPDRGADPLQWSLEGSTDAGGAWASCGANGGRFVSQGESRIWLTTNAASFNAYRVNISQNNGSGAVTRVGELRLYEFEPVTISAWVVSSAPFGGWRAVASSADGTRLFAAQETAIFRSTNSGVTWEQTSAANHGWRAIACSSDGQIILAGGGGKTFRSPDGGQSWIDTGLPAGAGYEAVACSTNGGRMVAASSSTTLGKVWLSSNFGQTWSDTGLPARQYSAAAASASGEHFYVAARNYGFVISRNFGSTWGAYTDARQWLSIATSHSGNLVVAGLLGGGIHRSLDHGATFNQTAAPQAEWTSIASSAAGFLMTAASEQGIWSSTDAGANWEPDPTPVTVWRAVAMSSDGSKRAAAATGGGLWITGSPIPSSPEATTTAADQLEGTRARLNGSVHAGYAPTTIWFQWGLTTNYANTSAATFAGSIAAALPFNHTISNLSPLTTYQFRVVASNIFGVKHGSNVAFSTVGGLPVATTLNAAGVTHLNAFLNGQANPNYLATTAWLEWGLNTNYGNRTAQQGIGNGGSALPISARITSLAETTTYHFRAVASNSLGVSYGTDVSFTTLAASSAFDLMLAADAITASSPNSPGPQAVPNAIDNSAATKYLNFDKLNTGFTVTPSVTNRPVRALSLISAEDAPERDPASFILDGSNDGTTFTRIASNAIPPFIARRSVQSISFANTNMFAHYRVTFPTVQNPGAANSMQIAEVELLPHGEITSPGDGVSITLPGGAVDVNGVGKLLDRQFDGSQKLEIAPLAGGSTIVDVNLAAGSGVLKGFQVIGAADDFSYPERRPSLVTVAGSNDGTNFITLGGFVPAAPSANMELQQYSILTNTVAYGRYRITFGPPVGGDRLQAGELRLFGELAARPSLSTRASGGNILVSWPNLGGYSLESKTNLNQLNWTAVTNAPVLSNGVNTVTLPMSAAPVRFFQLRK